MKILAIVGDGIMHQFRFSVLVWPSLLALLIVSPRQTHALDPSKEIVQYSHRAWMKRDGLPQNSVLCITQTRDGYLWAGTMEGLVRFDGTAFKVYNLRNTPGLKSQYISALATTSDGALVVGSVGGGITVMRDGKFTHVAGSMKPEDAAIRCFMEDRERGLWAGTSAGLWKIDHDSVTVRLAVSDSLPSNVVTSIALDRDGRMLVSTKSGIAVRQGSSFGAYFPASSVHAWPIRLSTDASRGLWIGTADKGLYRVGHDSVLHFSKREGLLSEYVTALCMDRDGAVWIGTSMGGVNRLFRGLMSSFSARDGLIGDQVHAIFEDREGNIWFGTSTGGLNRLVNSKLTTFRVGATAAQNMVWTLFEDRHGTLMAGNAERELYEMRNGRFLRSSRIRDLLPAVPAAYCEDKEGNLWIGTPKGILRERGGRTTSYPIGSVLSLFQDSKGRMWAGTSGGLLVRRGDAFRKVPLPEDGKPLSICAIAEDRNHNLWIGTMNAGALMFPLPADSLIPGPDGKPLFVRYNRQNGLLALWVTSIHQDTEGTIWLTTYGGGLAVVEGERAVSLTTANGLPEDGLFVSLEDAYGYLWISSNNGIHRVAKSSILSWVRGEIATVPATSYHSNDGMVSDECNGGYQASGVRTRDGRLWFPTTMGVVMADPSALPVNTVAPLVALEKMIIDRQESSGNGDLRFPPGDGEMEFYYAALSLSSPEYVRYKVKLEGFDKEWNDAGTRRVAYYTNIPPGDYIFRVIAGNNDGVWNNEGAAVAFVLEPHFRQTIWFFAILGICVMMLGAGIHHLYRRDRDRQLIASQLESKLARVQLQVLEMQLQPHFLFNALNGIMVLIHDDPEKASRMIARLSEFLRLALERRDLGEVTLQKELEFLDRYLQIELLRFGDRLTVEQKIDSESRDALVPSMILQPLVENAIRHGVSKRRGPAAIWIEAARTNGSLDIHVRDNGAGLADNGGEELKEGIGLRNTRARLQQLYGGDHKITLAGIPGGGVDVMLSIPFHRNLDSSWTRSER
jgi:ligand-binding sensor domain-containing protein